MVGETVLGISVAKFWAIIAALIGALTGAWLNKPQSKTAFVVNTTLGALASLIVAPAIIGHWFPGARATSEVVAMTYWACGTGAMTLIPALLKRAVRGIIESKLPAEPKV